MKNNGWSCKDDPDRDAVLRVRAGFTFADAQQRFPAIEFLHTSRRRSVII